MLSCPRCTKLVDSLASHICPKVGETEEKYKARCKKEREASSDKQKLDSGTVSAKELAGMKVENLKAYAKEKCGFDDDELKDLKKEDIIKMIEAENS